MANNRRRSSLVAIHADKGTQQGSLDARGIGLLILVLAAIIAFWVNEFIPSEDADTWSTADFMRNYKKGGDSGVQHSHGSSKHHQQVSPFKLGSMKECEKLVAQALQDYIDRQAAIAVEEDDDDDSEEDMPPPPKKAAKKGKRSHDDSEEEVKGKPKKGSPKAAKPKKK